MNNKFYVYVLQNPLKAGVYTYGDFTFDAQPFYVGKGCGNRWKEHLKCKDQINVEKNITIEKILEAGLTPLVSFVFSTNDEKLAYKKESEIISIIGRKLFGGILLNRTGGGSGCSSGAGHPRFGCKHSPATISLLKELAKNRPVDFYLRIGATNKGRKDSEETRIKKSKAVSGENNPFYGKTHTEATREKMKSRVMSEENKQLLSNLYKGVPLTEEHKANIRSSSLRGEYSPAWGVPKSAEEKARQVKKKAKYRYVIQSRETKYIVYSLGVFCRYHGLDTRALTRSLECKYAHKGMKMIEKQLLPTDWLSDPILAKEYESFALLYAQAPSRKESYKQAA